MAAGRIGRLETGAATEASAADRLETGAAMEASAADRLETGAATEASAADRLVIEVHTAGTGLRAAGTGLSDRATMRAACPSASTRGGSPR